MVQRFFLSALKPPSGATRGAWFHLVTSKCLAVTAEAAGFLVRIPNSEKLAEPCEDHER